MIVIKEAVVLVLGLLLIWSGWLHLRNPFEFFRSVMDYSILERRFAGLFAMFLPGFMITVGCGLVFGIWRKSSHLLGSILFMMFGMAQAIALLRGLDISCGCFGSGSHNVSFRFVFLWLLASAFLFGTEFWFKSDVFKVCRSTKIEGVVDPK